VMALRLPAAAVRSSVRRETTVFLEGIWTPLLLFTHVVGESIRIEVLLQSSHGFVEKG
jgi:hypothetical protein